MNILSGLYGRATEVRRAWYGRHAERRRRLDRPVVSVGNLVLGGSGKTPIVATLARLLAAAGERPAVLSRGYGRRRGADGVVVVRDAERLLATPQQSGDEPYMLARALAGIAVLVSPDRYLAGRLAERRLGCTVQLLDDGFQHVQLERDVDLLVMAKADLDERLLPFGSLREPLAAARAADALLVAGDETDLQEITVRAGVAQAFRVVPHYQAVRPIAGQADLKVRLCDEAHVQDAGVEADLQVRLHDVRPPPGRPRAVAVAGIARPERFFRALRELGWDVVREIPFRDHHWFTARDVAAVEQAATGSGADVVITTEKDVPRLPPYVGRVPQAWEDERLRTRRSPGTIPWVYLPLEIAIEPADAFATWLAGRLAAARRRMREAQRHGEGGEAAA